MTLYVRKIPSARLQEGAVYPFLVGKLVSLNEKESYYVMQDPNGYKVLMPAWYYHSYKLVPGTTIECRVDKINCNGRMFLEPRHPYYQEGSVYPFRIVGSGERMNLLGYTEYYLDVIDKLDQIWQVVSSDNKLALASSEYVDCLVERIKKGRLYLKIHGDKSTYPILEPGRKYRFQITDQQLHPTDGLMYFLLEDENRRKHLLKKKYYVHYGFRIGMEICCVVDSLASDGHYLLEPEHPCYTIGEVYDFPITRLEKLEYSDGFVQQQAILSDCHYEEVKVLVDDETLPLYQGKETVSCRVIRIRKSRLEVEPA